MSSRERRGSAGLLAVVASTSVLGLLALALAACPGSLENKEQFLDAGPEGCGDVPVQLIGPRCATSNCHDADAPVAALDLTPDDGLAARLVGVEGDGCMGLLVDPDAPEESLMYTKCLEVPGCQSRMPLTGDKLTPDEEQCLLEWIETL